MPDCYFEADDLNVVGEVADSLRIRGASFDRGNPHRKSFLRAVADAGLIGVAEGTAETVGGRPLGRAAGNMAHVVSERI